MRHEQEQREDAVIPIERVGIIGKNGQIGGMLTESLSGLTSTLTTAGRGEISQLMEVRPEVVFLATPNPVGETIREIVAECESPTLVILLQNGVGVVNESLPLVQDSPVSLLRAGIFTIVSKELTTLVYNDTKLRIALAPVPGMPTGLNRSVNELLGKAGFAVRQYEDYRSLEWTKLLLNCLGATSTVTGLTPYETFTDSELFSWEIKGVQDRLQIMKQLGIPVAPIPWGKTGLIEHLAPWVPEHPIGIIQRTIAGIIAKGRENLPSSASRKITSGADVTEVLEYHRPYMYASPVDDALFRIILGHHTNQYSLTDMTYEERRIMLREYMMIALKQH